MKQVAERAGRLLIRTLETFCRSHGPGVTSWGAWSHRHG